MLLNSFLGTRADAVVDAVLVLFIALPALLLMAFRLAARGGYRAHRNLQFGLLVTVCLAILLLELDIRFSDLMEGARTSSLHGSRLLASTFAIHVTVAVATFVSWLLLAVTSWRRFSERLPGSFSTRHRLWGRTVFAGVCLTSLTGALLYSFVFVF